MKNMKHINMFQGENTLNQSHPQDQTIIIRNTITTIDVVEVLAAVEVIAEDVEKIIDTTETQRTVIPKRIRKLHLNMKNMKNYVF